MQEPTYPRLAAAWSEDLLAVVAVATTAAAFAPANLVAFSIALAPSSGSSRS